MPDEHGRITEADNDLIETWRSQHSKDSVICPVCKTTNWKIAGHLVNIQSEAADANASNTPTYPHIIIACNFCAHSMFFNAVQIGVTGTHVPPARQPTAGAAASGVMRQSILELNHRLSDLVKNQD